MSVTTADDELFTRAIYGFRDAFLDQISHLPEPERMQLWRQRLSEFMAPTAVSPATPAYRSVSGSSILGRDTSPSEKSGKRARQETPRTLPDFGLPPTKRRVTVCDLLWPLLSRCTFRPQCSHPCLFLPAALLLSLFHPTPSRHQSLD